MKRLADEDRLIPIGHALFAVVGFKRVYTPGLLRITRADFVAAVKLEPKLYDIVEDFLDGKRDDGEMPPYDHEETSKLLHQQITLEDAANNLTQFQGHPSGDEFAMVATLARQHLAAKIPARMRLPRLGIPAEPAQPSRAELITFRRHVATIEDPAWAVRQLLSATLGRDHIEALRLVWTDVLEVVGKAAMEGCAARLAKDPTYRTSRRVARQLAVLLGKSELDAGFVRDLQATFAREAAAAAQAQPPAPRATPAPMDDSNQTIVQRIADQR